MRENGNDITLSPVDREVVRLNDQVGDLFTLVENLEKQLSSVLGNGNATADGCKESEPKAQESELTEYLKDINARIYTLKDKIYRISERLEV